MISFFNRRKHRTKVLTNTTRTALSPLDITEILELVFSYLDDYTLRRSVSLVCRQWHLHTQDRLVREVTWHQGWKSAKSDRALRRLRGAGRFRVCHFGNGTTPIVNVLRALGSVESAYQKQLDQRKQTSVANNSNNSTNSNRCQPTLALKPTSTPTPTLYAYTPLRELVLYTAFCNTDFLDSFPYPSSLTKLIIQVGYSHYAECDLNRILEQCPLLEHFCIETFGIAGLRVKLSTFSSATTRPLPLLSLVLLNASFAQFQLETLLRLTPHLKELKMKAMLWHDSKSYDWARLFLFLKANGIALDKAHFSTMGIGMSAKQSEQLLEDVYPQLTTERSIWAGDMTPQFFLSVISQPNILTALEICWMPTASFSPRGCCYAALASVPGIVHQHLCDSPHLVHLTALKTMIRMQDLDLFQRAGYLHLNRGHDPIWPDNGQDASAVAPGSPKIWRCRGLRTLHIEVHAPGQFQLQHPVHSRIIFGYIARVCPLLEDLQIHFPRDCQSSENGHFYRTYPCLQLKGGLCLLGRLKYLHSLRVCYDTGCFLTSGARDWDLNWMTAAGRKNTRSRKKRQMEVESWRIWRLNEDRAEKARSSRTRIQGLPQDNETNNSKADNKIMDEFQRLGLLLDVEEMLKEMDRTEESRPFPSLERLSLNYPILQRPEEEIENSFPSRKWRHGCR